ncbi:MAG: LysR family transcriptional regulator [Rhodobacteraceae bacterium]|nr:LysR family transcriptional regulator [Paracoccaceae bacterium]
MHFTLKQLRYFDAALRTGSIANAASEMNISQSSITAAINAVEDATKAELFRRMPAKGIKATERGREVGKRIQQFLEQARIFESDVLSLAGQPSGTLRLGCYAPTAPHVLPPILKQLSKQYPDIRIDLREGDMMSIQDLLKAGTVDLALTYRRDEPEQLGFVPMFAAHPIALVPDMSPLAQQTKISLQELADQPMILLDLPGARPYFFGLFEAEGLTPRVVHTTKSSSVLRGLVAANFGYGLVNICGPNERDGQNGFVARPVGGDQESPQYGVAFTEVSRRSTIVQAALTTCADISAQGGFDHLIVNT